MPSYYVRRPGGSTSGPHDVAAIKAMACDGTLLPSDQLSKDGQRWLPASQAKGLVFRQPPPAAEAASDAADDRDILLGWFSERWQSCKAAWLRSAEAAKVQRAERAKLQAAERADKDHQAAEQAAAKLRSVAMAKSRRRGTYLWITSNAAKLSTKVKTPFGSNITVVRMWLAAEYEVVDGQVHILSVRLAHPRETPDGKWNMFSDRTGEAFVCPIPVPPKSLEGLLALELDDHMKRRMIRQLQDGEG